MFKKILFFFLIFSQILFSQFKNLQNFDEKDIRFGYYIGINQYDNKVEYKNNTAYPISVERAEGINVGLIGELKLNKNFFLSCHFYWFLAAIFLNSSLLAVINVFS